MGIFDYIRFNDKTYQTKDTPMQTLAEYEIRGSELWYLEPISSEWRQMNDFDGAIRFYDKNTDYLAMFWEGKLIQFKRLNDLH